MICVGEVFSEEWRSLVRDRLEAGDPGWPQPPAEPQTPICAVSSPEHHCVAANIEQ
jgi:hypothetical protein